MQPRPPLDLLELNSPVLAPAPSVQRHTCTQQAYCANVGGVAAATARTGAMAASDDDPLRKVMCSAPLTLIRTMFARSEAPHTWLQPVLKVLLEGRVAADAIKTLITEEVDACKHAETLFRTNSLCTFAMTHLALVAGRQFIQEVLKTIVLHALACPMPVEVSVRKLGDLTSEQVMHVTRDNTSNLLVLGETTFRIIQEELPKVPRQMRELCQHLKEEMERKFKKDAKTSIAIGGFFFLRFVCPAIVSPVKYGIIERALLPREVRVLVLLSKMLQNLSNQVPFNETDMRALNHTFVQPLMPEMAHLQDSLADVEGSLRAPIVVKSTQLRRLRAMFRTHQQALTHALEPEGLSKELLASAFEGPLGSFKRSIDRGASFAFGQEALNVYEIAPKYNSLLWIFLNSKKILITHMYKHVLPSQKDLVATFAFQLWGSHITMFSRFLKQIVSRELEACREVGELFRISSLATNVCSVAMKTIAAAFLRKLLAHCDTLVSVDPLPDIEAFTLKIIAYIGRKMWTIPVEVGGIAREMHDACESRFVGGGRIAVSGLLFQRFICVALVRTATENRDFSPEQARLFVSASRILQKLSTASRFREADDLHHLNDFVDKNRSRLHDILDQILQPQNLRHSAEVRAGEVQLGHARLTRESVETISQLVSENIDDALRALRGASLPYDTTVLDSMGTNEVLAYKGDVALLNALQLVEAEQQLTGVREVLLDIQALKNFSAERYPLVYCVIRKDGQTQGVSDPIDTSAPSSAGGRFSFETENITDPLMIEVYDVEHHFIGSGRVLLSPKIAPAASVTKVFLHTLEDSRKIENGTMRIGEKATRRSAGSLEVEHCTKPRTMHPLPLSEDDWRRLLASSLTIKHRRDDVAVPLGVENSALFRVVSGSYRAEMHGKTLGLLPFGSVFGEISFLGRRLTTCDVVANEDGSAVRQVNSSYLSMILEGDPSLFSKFYFFLASVLASRLAEPSSEAVPTRARSGSDTRPSHRRNRSIEEPPVMLKESRVDSQRLSFALSREPQFELPPRHEKFALIKQLKCKIGKWGDLLMFPSRMVHTCSLFGFGKTISVSYDLISNIVPDSPTSFQLCTEKKSRKMHFHSHEDMQSAFVLLSELRSGAQPSNWQSRPSTDSVPSSSDSGGESGDETLAPVQVSDSLSYAGDVKIRHAVVIKACPGTRTHLDLKPGEQVFVLRESGNEWLGIRKGETGLFPADCVELQLELNTLSPLINSGHIDCTHLPSPKDWVELLSCGCELVFTKGTAVIKEGFPLASIFQIIDGTCDIIRADQDSAEQVVVSRGDKGSIFGELSWILDRPTSASVVVTSDEMRCFHFDGLKLKQFLRERAMLSGRFYKYLAIIVDRWTRIRCQPTHAPAHLTHSV